MYGAPLSFINVSGWSEDGDDGDPHCIINVVEVAVVFQFTRSLIKDKKTPGILIISIVSPYDSQVALIQDKLGMHSDNNGVILKVQTVEQFQGDGDNAAGEDLIIFSTVRANDTGSIGGLFHVPRKLILSLQKLAIAYGLSAAVQL